jgi:transposase-like protein
MIHKEDTMPGEDTITMAQHELRRLHVIRKAIDQVITQKHASEVIGISLRQVQRMVARVRCEGDKGIIHKSRGQPSNRSISDATRRKALTLFNATYHDFGPTLATEKLFERDKIKINDETFRLWLKERKKRPHRQWRERKACFGQMVQMDGSHHAWLEKRGPWCVFMGYIDDATGIPFGRFYTYEGTNPAMDSFKRYITRYGIPQSVYLDNHSTYKSSKRQSIEDELKNEISLSQFERAADELGIRVIHADSPQAKGRVERIFRTFQDRLVKDLRLEGITTIDEANDHLRYFLPKYTKRFAVKARKTDDLHRLIPDGMDLDGILCIKTPRVLRNDFTVAHDHKLYQIIDNVRTKKLVVEDRLNGSVVISHKNEALRFKEINIRSKKEEPKAVREFKLKRVYELVPANHPWRSFRFYSQYQQREKVAQKEKGLLLTV